MNTNGKVLKVPEPSLYLLRQFDPRQLFRLFVDGRFHKKYDGWVGYEKGERGSVQALLNGFSFMLDHFDLRAGLKSTYLIDLHKICMMGVQTKNRHSSPGDLRFINGGMPFFAKSTTRENIREILKMRKGDGTIVFNTKALAKKAEEISEHEVLGLLQSEGRINYRCWYPNLETYDRDCIQKKHGLLEFYKAKHKVQMMFAQRVDEIVIRFNHEIARSQTEEARLHSIALVVRELELLHPFPDGNCRTVACVLLTQLLLNYGFPPALLENPNLDGECSLHEWMGEIRKGIDKFMELLRNPMARVYGYSIDDQSTEHQERFAEMSNELVAKIQETNVLYLNSENIERYTGGRWINGRPSGLKFTGVGTYGTYARGNIYFALQIAEWERDGKDVQLQLKAILAKEQRALVLDREQYAHGLDVPVLLVSDAMSAFRDCAVSVRQELNPWTILITGTEGKTGAKVQIHHLLDKQVKTHAVINSANTDVPVLRSLASLCVDHRVEVNEVAVYSNDDEYRTERSRIVSPNICLFTNIGPNQMHMHKTMDNLVHAKSSVVPGLREGGTCILNAANPYFEGLAQAIRQRRSDATIATYGEKECDHAQLISSKYDAVRLGWNVVARIDGVVVSYLVPLPQSHAPLASVGVLLAIKRSGFDVTKAAADYSSLQPYKTMGGVVKLKNGEHEVLFYDQSRRGDISGMRSAFSDLARLKGGARLVALVGGISVLHDGEWTRNVHWELADLINGSPIDRLFTTGNYFGYVHERLKRQWVKHSNNLDELAVDIFEELKPGDMLFIIGHGRLELDRVAEAVAEMFRHQHIVVANAYLQEPYATKHRLLKLHESVAKGLGPRRSCATYGIEYSAYVESLAVAPDYTAYRSKMLQAFFAQLPDRISPIIKAMPVDGELVKTKFASHIVTPKFCTQWFNNFDKNLNLPKKQCFGSFFDFGDPQYLLHIEVATFALHIGLVRCVKTEAGYAPEAMTQAMFDELCQRWPQLPNLGVQLRSWGPRWASLELGSFIDVMQPEIFMAMSDLGQSKQHMDKIQDFLAILTSSPISQGKDQ